MNVLGIDPSSSCTGLALMGEGGRMLEYAVWKPTKAETKAGGAVRYFSYYRWLNAWIGFRRKRIDMVCVEELGVTRGFKTVRALVQFETLSMLVPRQHGLITTSIKAGVARNMVLDVPITTSKADSHVMFKKMYPHIQLPTPAQGGLDVADAAVMGIVGPDALAL